ETAVATVTTDASYVVGSPAAATGAITNDDAAPVTQPYAITTWANRAVINRPTAATDANGDTLSYTLGTPPARGTVAEVAASDGLFLYTPNANYFGADSFTLHVSDGANTTPLAVSVGVAPAPASGTLIYTSVGASDANAVGTSPYNFSMGYTSLLLGRMNTMYGEGKWALSNRGVNGFTAADLRREVGGKTVLSLASADSPRAITLWVGPNDVKNFFLKYPGTTPEQTATPEQVSGFLSGFNTDYSAVLTALKATGAAIVTANVPRIGNAPVAGNSQPYYLNLTPEQKDALNAMCEQMSLAIGAAAGTTVPVVDGYTSSAETIVADFAADGFHPSNQGYQKLADAVWPLMRPQINRKPVAGAQTLTTLEGVAKTGVLTATDPDKDEDGLTFAVTQPAAGKGAVVVDAATGDFTFTPAAGYGGDASFTFSASDGDASSDAATITMTVNAVATKLIVSAPQSATAGSTFNLTVTATNEAGYTDAGYVGTIRFTSDDAQAGLPSDYTFTAMDEGSRTFTVTLRAAGSRTLTATDTTTASISGTDTVSVDAAAASAFVVAGFPSPTKAGASHSFTVTARDAFGNLATNYSGTVNFSSSDDKATLPTGSTLTNGTETFSATFSTPGIQSLSAADSVTPSISGSQTAIKVIDPLIVTTVSDDDVNSENGKISLREALAYANTHSGVDSITFALPDDDAIEGKWTIAPTSALSTISESVIIDGAGSIT
ncbi:MAG TPA: Ig-like domain-containing protein, partial [Abditibacteriaceae bacterium]